MWVLPVLSFVVPPEALWEQETRGKLGHREESQNLDRRRKWATQGIPPMRHALLYRLVHSSMRCSPAPDLDGEPGLQAHLRKRVKLPKASWGTTLLFTHSHSKTISSTWLRPCGIYRSNITLHTPNRPNVPLSPSPRWLLGSTVFERGSQDIRSLLTTEHSASGEVLYGQRHKLHLRLRKKQGQECDLRLRKNSNSKVSGMKRGRGDDNQGTYLLCHTDLWTL